MQRILVRKNLVYKLLAKKSAAEKEEPKIKQTHSIKDLIKNTLEQYKDQDDMDIELLD